MRIIDIVRRLTDAGDRRLLLDEAEDVRPELVSFDDAGDDGEGRPSVRLALVPAGSPSDDLCRALTSAGDRDIVVLLLADPPADLPVGALVDAVAQAGLSVLDASPVVSRHARTALVVSRDASLPLRSYLIGDPLERSAESTQRLLTERAIEGLVQRAAAHRDGERLLAFDAEVGALSARLETAEDKVATLTRENAALAADVARLKKLSTTQAAELARRDQSLPRLARRAVGAVRGDARRGTARIIRALLLRAGKRD
jgi:hypothetical protein